MIPRYEVRFIRGKWRIVAVVPDLILDREFIELPFEYETQEQAEAELRRAGR